MSLPAKFHDLPADHYPVTMRAYSAMGALVWEEVVPGPAAVFVPPLAKTYGPVSIEIEFATGEVQKAPPPP